MDFETKQLIFTPEEFEWVLEHFPDIKEDVTTIEREIFNAGEYSHNIISLTLRKIAKVDKDFGYVVANRIVERLELEDLMGISQVFPANVIKRIFTIPTG